MVLPSDIKHVDMPWFLSGQFLVWLHVYGYDVFHLGNALPSINIFNNPQKSEAKTNLKDKVFLVKYIAYCLLFICLLIIQNYGCYI